MDNKEKLDKIQAKINQLNAQKQTLISREKEKERKARTRRLIQIGAIMDSIGINNEILANEFKNYFINTPKSKEWLEKFIAEKEQEKTQ